MAERPVDTREIPEGYELVAIVDPDWRLVKGKRCRWRGGGHFHAACGRPAIAELDRGAWRGPGHRENWWAYCVLRATRGSPEPATASKSCAQ